MDAAERQGAAPKGRDVPHVRVKYKSHFSHLTAWSSCLHVEKEVQAGSEGTPQLLPQPC